MLDLFLIACFSIILIHDVCLVSVFIHVHTYAHYSTTFPYAPAWIQKVTALTFLGADALVADMAART